MINYLLKKCFFIQFLFLVLVASFLYGCGFHLRSWNEGMPKFMQKVYIRHAGTDFNFLNTLTASINATGAEVVTSSTDADVTIDIKSATSSRRLIGITGGASSNDYVLSYSANYDILNNKNQAILKNQNNSASQTYTTNATQQLSSNAQQHQIYNNLQSQVASNIILQIQSISESRYNKPSSDH
ncbi:LPS assembly lipoprotein LptE [Fastidiosibacter lacustris]|uniref:LPS-assembly lipoprotein LptE n=1 Tax=Fastidiosibacter lacustris TaxID=2056695 RepID=UPI000E3476D9|nr:LPS assembly lipoprotein LptE [Fastidiosibacter lacustris]